MQLTRQTLEFSRWVHRVMTAIRGVRRWTTHGVVIAEAVSDVTRLMTSLLPLKVILLAASPGVPRYFPFIDPNQKSGWIVGLAAATFVVYGVTLALEALARRLSEGASTDVLEGANEMVLSSNQHERAQSAYASLCRMQASTAFVVVGGSAITLVNPPLGAYLVSILALQYGFTAWALSGPDEVAQTGFKGWILRQFNTYLGLQQSITFLFGFLVILAPYVFGSGGNVIFALISVIALRQVLGALARIVKTGVSLTRQRDQINAFVFHEEPVYRSETTQTRGLRELFAKERRQQHFDEVIGERREDATPAEVAWSDSPRRFFHTFTVGPITFNNRQRWFQQQVFPPQARAQLENESFLFRHIHRPRLYAPERIDRLDEPPFAIQILDFGQGRYLTKDEWKHARDQLIIDVLACRPPAELVASYKKSNQLMHERIDTALLDRLAVAVDTTAEREALATARARINEIREHLEALPLYIDNPDIEASTTGMDDQGYPLAMIWGRWSLRPLGGGLLTSKHRVDVTAFLPDVLAAREYVAGGVSGEDVELAGQCRVLEQYESRQAYKAALGLLPDMIENLDRPRSACAA